MVTVVAVMVAEATEVEGMAAATVTEVEAMVMAVAVSATGMADTDMLGSDWAMAATADMAIMGMEDIPSDTHPLIPATTAADTLRRVESSDDESSVPPTVAAGDVVFAEVGCFSGQLFGST